MQKRDTNSRGGGGLGRVVRFGTTVHNTIPYKVCAFAFGFREREGRGKEEQLSKPSRVSPQQKSSTTRRVTLTPPVPCPGLVVVTGAEGSRMEGSDGR